MVYEFGEFQLDALRGRLFRRGEAVPLTPKAAELLLALVETPGQLVEKDQLMARLWPDSHVEESNLTVNMSALRRALGESPADRRFIVTVPGRGYRFAASVSRVDSTAMEPNGPRIATSAARTDADVQEHGPGLEGSETGASTGDAETHGLGPGPASGLRRWPVWRLAFAMATLVVVGVLFWVMSPDGRRSNPPATGVRTLAVLPFETVGSGSSDRLLEAGLVETLVLRLTHLGDIVVRPTASVRRFAGTQDPVAAGRELQVDAVLEGHLQRDGNRLRITLQLIGVQTQRPLWSANFDEAFTDVFAVEDAASERIAAALVPVLTGDIRRRLTKRYTNNEAAYRAFAAGRLEADKFTRAGSLAAIDFFKRAVEIDPAYALAWAGLADAYIWFCIDQAPPREMLPPAEAAARRALDLDAALSDAHASLAMIKYRSDYDWAAAELEFRRALEFDAHDGQLHQKYGWYLAMLGRIDEARAQMRLAGQLDPLSLPIQMDLGLPEYAARQFDASIATAQRILEQHPRFANGYFDVALAQLGAGRPADALLSLRRGTPFDDTPEVIAHAAIAHARLGHRLDAQAAIERLKAMAARRYVSPASIGLIHAALGDRDAAFEWLEKGYQDRSWWMIFLRVDSRFDPLRSDPRFGALLREVGLS